MKTIQTGQVIKTRPRSKDTLICNGLHPAVISEDLYNSVQEIRKKNPPRPVSIANSIRNPLAGIVYCSKCGRAMVRRPYQKLRAGRYPHVSIYVLPHSEQQVISG